MEGKCKYAATLQPEKKCNKTLPPADGDSEDVQGGGAPKKKKSCDLDLSGGGKVKAPQVSKPPPGLLGGFQPPTAPVVKTITPEEQNALDVQKECNDPTLPDYWRDMCRTIPTNSSDYINLQLNPERWTGRKRGRGWMLMRRMRALGGCPVTCAASRYRLQRLARVERSLCRKLLRKGAG